MYKVDKKIPIPTARGKLALYPFDKMEIGDSFLVPNNDELSRVRAAIQRRQFDYKEKFATRKIEDNYRVWRIL